MLTFLILSVVMIIGAVGVITLKQPVHAALSLVGTLLTLAVTYVTLQAHFLAAIQVIVYAGAIMVLFLFVIMLLNIQGDERETTFAWMRPAAYAVAVIAALSIMITAFRSPANLPNPDVVSAALNGGGAAEVGEALFSEFILAFQLVGVLLLTGIIGAVSLVQRKAVEVAGLEPTSAVKSPALAASSGSGVAVLDHPEGVEAVELEPQPEPLEAEAVEEITSFSEKELLQEVNGSQEGAQDLKETDSIQDENETFPSSETTSPTVATEADNLRRIKGIGAKLEGILVDNGITTFAQIAALDKDAIQRLDKQLSVKGRIERDDWVGQAKQLLEENIHDNS